MAMPVYRWAETRYLSSVDGFVFNSRTTRADVANAIGRLKSNVIAYPGGDRLNPAIKPLNVIERASAAGPLRLLFLGNLIPRKGLHTLVSALAISGPGWRLDVVGPDADPSYASKVRSLVSKKGLSNRVTFRGALDDEALADVFRESHVLAVPSTYEGFGIVYMEGMGFGLPALATTSGAASETVRHGVNGFLIAPVDVAGLSQHVTRLIQDRALLAEMGQAALNTYAGSPYMAAKYRDHPPFPPEKSPLRIAPVPNPGTSDYHRYLAAKKSMDDRSLNPRVWDSLARVLPRTRTNGCVGTGSGYRFDGAEGDRTGAVNGLPIQSRRFGTWERGGGYEEVTTLGSRAGSLC